jgi:hypothetical protein
LDSGSKGGPSPRRQRQPPWQWQRRLRGPAAVRAAVVRRTPCQWPVMRAPQGTGTAGAGTSLNLRDSGVGAFESATCTHSAAGGLTVSGDGLGFTIGNLLAPRVRAGT